MLEDSMTELESILLGELESAVGLADAPVELLPRESAELRMSVALELAPSEPKSEFELGGTSAISALPAGFACASDVLLDAEAVPIALVSVNVLELIEKLVSVLDACT